MASKTHGSTGQIYRSSATLWVIVTLLTTLLLILFPELRGYVAALYLWFLLFLWLRWILVDPAKKGK